MEKKILSVLGVCVLAALIAVGYMQYRLLKSKTELTAQKNETLSVSVQTVKPTIKTIQHSFVGYVKPIHQVAIVPSVTGNIGQVNVQGGARVHVGDLLFTIQPDQYKAQLDLATAKVAQAEASLENARQYEKRLQKAGRRAVSQTDVDNAKTNVLTAQATLAEAQASEQLARINYGYTTITAPIQGTIGDVSVTTGDYVSPSGGSLATIIQFDPIRVIFSISNKDYLIQLAESQQDILNGWQVKLRLADGTVYPQTGRIQYINNEISGTTDSLVVYTDFDNPKRTLLANAYVDVVLEKQTNGIFIAQSLVHLTPQGGFVYTLSDSGIIQTTPVSVGPAVDSDFYIPDGLSAGMRVITDDVASYQVGMHANVKGN
ncbi:MAG: efflux RND transporter periplasmic adaptor subunit [Alphaproteobacteria bacterium]